MTDRFEYVLDGGSDLPTVDLPADVESREPTPSDREGLAELMLDAYRGTIDYDGETIDQARAEVASYFDGSADATPLLDASRVAVGADGIVSACLVSSWEHRSRPLIGYVMTRSAEKRRGIGRALLAESIAALRDEGHPDVRAVITDGNTPSERLFAAFGYRRANS